MEEITIRAMGRSSDNMHPCLEQIFYKKSEGLHMSVGMEENQV